MWQLILLVYIVILLFAVNAVCESKDGYIYLKSEQINVYSEPSISNVACVLDGTMPLDCSSESSDSWYKIYGKEWYIRKNDCIRVHSNQFKSYFGNDNVYCYGDTSDGVTWIQNKLFELSYYDGVVTGHFGQATLKGVNIFQTTYGLESTGIVDIRLAAMLQETLESRGGIVIESVNFPDNQFLNYVSKFDKDKDGFFTNEEMLECTNFNCESLYIQSLAGIEFFPNLVSLACNNNSLTELDVSKNEKLEDLNCEGNNIKELDLSQNHQLKSLNCNANQITSLSLSHMPQINKVYAEDNCYVLDISNNEFDLSRLPGNFDVSKAKNWQGGTVEGNILTTSEDVVTYDYDCGNNHLVCLKVINGISLDKTLAFDHFPDVQFLKYVAGTLDSDHNLYLSRSEIDQITEIYVDDRSISSLQGIEIFKQLKHLSCSANRITSIDLSQNTNLEVLKCSDNLISIIDLTENQALINLDLSGNPLSALDVSNNPSLKELDIRYNNIKELNVDSNLMLESLVCSGNDINTLDLTNNGSLRALSVSENNLTTLDLSNNPELVTLDCSDNKLEQLDLSNNPELIDLGCWNNQLGTLTFGNVCLIQELDVWNNNLEELDIGNMTDLAGLYCDNNYIRHLDLSNKDKLKYISCSNNKLNELDVSDCTNCVALMCGDNQISTIDTGAMVKLQELDCPNNQLMELDLRNNRDLFYLICDNNSLVELDTNNCKPYIEVSAEYNRRKIVGNIIDLPSISNLFDPSKASNWQGGTVEGMILTANNDRVTYDYDCGNGHTISFTLAIDNEKVVVADELTEVPAGLNYETVESLKNALTELLLQIDSGIIAGNTKTYDVKMLVTYDGGQTWKEASEEDFLENGIDVVIPYPTGTNNSYTFYAVHMFTKTSDRLGTVAGAVEYPSVITAPDGLHMKLKGLSPVAISWKSSKETHSDIEFHAKVLWQVGSEHPKAKIQLYKNGVVGEHFLIETQRSADEWEYDAYDLSIGAEYYAVVEVKTGYYVEYINRDMKETDKLFDGGVAIIRYMPPTGDFQKPWLYALITVISLFGTMLLVKKKNGW